MVENLKLVDAELSIDELCDRFVNKQAVVGILGLGYVGVPIGVAACRKGMSVIGFDVNEKKVNKLLSGKSYIDTIEDEVIQGFLDDGKFDVTTDFSRLKEADALLMCVPTPLTKQREPDLSYVVKTTEMILPYLRKGQIVILESTTWPGTMSEIVKPILEKSGLKSGVDFYLAYSPEREDPGNIDFSTSVIPKVVGGDGDEALKLALSLYDQFLKTVPVSNSETAEAVKLTENIFRAVNIALVNELKMIYDKMGIDIWEVIDAASTKPFGYMPFYPGPGLGGHCIPLDPFYLTWKAREHDVSTRFIELAGEINVSMPSYVVTNLMSELSDRFAKSLNGAKILIIGIAYKKNVSDMRESPAFSIMELLKTKKADISYFDPFIPKIEDLKEHAEFEGMASIEMNAENLKSFDAAVIVTNHSNIDYELIVKNSNLVIDTRNATADFQDKYSNISKS